MTHPIRDPKARKVQVGISLSLAALDMADAVVAALDHPHRSALMEELIRTAAEKHLPTADRSEESPPGRRSSHA